VNYGLQPVLADPESASTIPLTEGLEIDLWRRCDSRGLLGQRAGWMGRVAYDLLVSFSQWDESALRIFGAWCSWSVSMMIRRDQNRIEHFT